MKKRSAKKENPVKRIFNKMGMTYIELICALALLSLVVVMFTPMLLSSYENLYKAGEKVEAIYDSKEDMESELATRLSTHTINFDLDFKGIVNNATLLFDNLNVKGRRIVSKYQEDFETAFGMVRPKIEIITPDLVYDDKSNHDITIQTLGLEYTKISYGTAAVSESTLENGEIYIKAILPNKSVANTDSTNVSNNTQDETVYEGNGYPATIKLYNAAGNGFLSGSSTDQLNDKVNHGQISFNLSGPSGRPLDFTYSPVKILIYYKNNRGKLVTVSDYLYIDPPTMVFAGETNGEFDYYTSAGVEYMDTSAENTDGSLSGVYSITYEGRKMRVDNSILFADTDTLKSTRETINTVTWVEADENPNLKPYYVMAGTNGIVYRMYNLAGVKKTLTDIHGAKNSVDSTNDKTFIITDGSRVSPSFWSGEMSDQYNFRTQEDANGYGTYDTNKIDCSEGTRYNWIDKKLKYSMMFSSYNSGYEYHSQASRRISYVLSEAGNKSFRLAGKKRETANFVGYTSVWEKDDNADGEQYKFFARSGLTFNTTDERPVYLYVSGGTNDHFDKNFGYLRLRSYVSVDPFSLSKTSSEHLNGYDKGDFWYPSGDKWKKESSLKDCEPNTVHTDWLTNDYGNNAVITDAVYLPNSSSTGKGQVIYLGYVPAYALLIQASDIGTTSDATKVYNNDKVKESRITGYVISGSSGSGMSIYRYYNGNDTTNESVNVSNKLRDVGYDGTATAESNEYNFYTSTNKTNVYKYTNDTHFTFGYCSRWRMTMGDVTSDGQIEEPRSYEKYYKASNPLAKYYHDRSGSKINVQGLNKGDCTTEDNLYYNVWFPGEYYNLTHSVTVDGVTVAVGYTVAGSSYMRQSEAVGSGYYGTALGSVYNDGVIAAYVSLDAGGVKFDNSGLDNKGEQNVIFQNLLYYKMPQFTNNTTHSRQSVRFTAVGMYSTTEELPQNASGTTTVNKNYVAIYGDSLGNAYYSIIASSTVTGKYVTVKDEATGKEVQEWVGTESGIHLRSEENKDALKARAFDNEGNIQNNDMIPIEVDGKPLSTYFSEITTVVAEEGLVVISGKPKGGDYNKEMLVVCYDADGNGNYAFKMVENSQFTGYINDAKFIGNYLYFVGGDSNGGWCAAIGKEALVNLAKDSGNSKNTWSRLVPSNEVTSTTDPSKLIYFQTPSILNSFDGRVTKH